jgi:hypothetical protein
LKLASLSAFLGAGVGVVSKEDEAGLDSESSCNGDTTLKEDVVVDKFRDPIESNGGGLSALLDVRERRFRKVLLFPASLLPRSKCCRV